MGPEEKTEKTDLLEFGRKSARRQQSFGATLPDCHAERGKKVKTFFLIPQSFGSRVSRGAPRELEWPAGDGLRGSWDNSEAQSLCSRQPLGTVPLRSHFSSGGEI